MDDITFQLGVTDLKVLAETHGCRYELSADGQEEMVIKPDGTVLIRAYRLPPDARRKKRKDATVWMRAIKAHTYGGHPKDVGDVYLAHEEQVENILNLKFAVVDTPPPLAKP